MWSESYTVSSSKEKIMRSGIYCVIILFVAGVCAFADDSVVAYWPLDGNADDLSGKGRDGVAVNGPVWSSEGFTGGCVSLDGVDDYVEILGYQGITGGASRTCMAWINTSKLSAQILSWGAAQTGAKWVTRVNDDGTLRAEVAGGYLYGTTTIADGAWHHIAVVLADDGSSDISEALLYVDGMLDTIGGAGACAVNTIAADNVKIGVYSAGLRYFEGLIDDVQIYDRALSGSEIADVVTDFEGDGDGTAANPYQISTPLQLLLIGSNPVMLNKHFVLVNDIDLSGVIYTNSLIAPDANPGSDNYEGSPFIGTFDGGYYSIRNMTIAGAECIGLFGKIGEGGTVVNLRVENATIEGDLTVGGLCGINEGILMNCSTEGLLTGQGSIGGLCGFNEGVVTGSFADGQIVSGGSAGGLCGYNRYEGALTGCYASGTIAGPQSVGGLCGRNEGAAVSCYSTCTVPAVANPNSNSYIGGLCGSSDGTFESCFWDMEASGSSVATGYQDLDPAGTQGLTTAAMQNPVMCIFLGWDFVGESYNGREDLWRICRAGQTYPQLSWEFENGNNTECTPVVDDAQPYGGGTGTEDDPYLIYEPLHLYEMVFDTGVKMNGVYPASPPQQYYYVMTGDIDMEGYPMQPISQGTSIGGFAGFFDGQGHIIRHLTINQCTPVITDYGVLYSEVGLFSNLGLLYFHQYQPGFKENVIQNLVLEDVLIEGWNCTGAIAGAAFSSHVVNCFASGTVSNPTDSSSARMNLIGGLIGENSSELIRCASACTVVNKSHRSGYLGGLVGFNSADLIDCYASGAVINDSNGSVESGGLIGTLMYGRVSNCYSAGMIDPGSNGLGGGFIGTNWDFNSELSDCFWDTGTSGVSVGVGVGSATGVTGKSTADMQAAATFTDAGWDFVGESVNGQNEICRMCVDGVDYPRLSWEFARGGDFACGDGVDLADLQVLAEEWLTSTETDAMTFNFAADANGDERIDLADFTALSNNWP
jgi:hypothetical protein